MQREELPDGGILFDDLLGPTSKWLSAAGELPCLFPCVNDFVVTDICEYCE
jgi:hypothetical protein